MNSLPLFPRRGPEGAALALSLPVLVGGLLFFLGLHPAAALEPKEARSMLNEGDYSKCIKACSKAIEEERDAEEWLLLLGEALMTVGRYPDAYSLIRTNLPVYENSVRLRVLGYEVFRHNGHAAEAGLLLSQINQLAGTRMWAYQGTADLVALGRAFLLMGADPRQVLEQLYDRAKTRDPTHREPYLASGELALTKGDYDLAAKVFREGLKGVPGETEFFYGLARAYATSDRRQMLASIEAALDQNPKHIPSYLLLADHLLDGEGYEEAEETLQEVMDVNPHHPEAWGYRAVLAHLANDPEGESKAREEALRYWKNNPTFDHLVGRKLSQKYRFAEGAASQQRALLADPQFLPARIQLAQDLLRLGDEDEGWRLVREVGNADAYDVTAFNLTALQENMAKFTTLTNRNFILRMATNEAAIYGQRAMDLLQEAKTNLCAKYGLELTLPTVVEIFPNQKDFGVRTFGMPGNPGYLGVCFGRVITANSPASQGAHPANWEAVLWHEFCHVVTLQLTKNKMPRWLSEGISVYEELQRNPTWGQRMTPEYREMILGEDFTPLGELSGAFLTPKSAAHLQFAYYESALAVEFLAGRFGLDAIRKILRELGEGVEVNVAISKHTAALDEIEDAFETFVRDRAENLAPTLDFERPERGDDFEDVDSKNFYILTAQAQMLFRERKWEEAKVPLKRLIENYPEQNGRDNAYSILAMVHRYLKETNSELAVLSALADRKSDALDAYGRLIVLNATAGDWPEVVKNAKRYLAVNPLVALPYRYLAEAEEALGRKEQAIDASRVLLQLESPDPAGTHYRLARLLHEAGDPAAKRHLLQALEEAPRFREAHRLLLKMHKPPNKRPEPEPPAPVSPPTAKPPAKTTKVKPAENPVAQPTAEPSPRPAAEAELTKPSPPNL